MASQSPSFIVGAGATRPHLPPCGSPVGDLECLEHYAARRVVNGYESIRCIVARTPDPLARQPGSLGLTVEVVPHCPTHQPAL